AGRCKIKTDGIDAVALPCGGWPIRKDVSLMRSTTCTNYFSAEHSVARVADIAEMVLGEWLGEARPSGAALKFRAAVKERQAAQPAGENAGAFLIKERSAKRCFRAVFEQDMPFIRA